MGNKLFNEKVGQFLSNYLKFRGVSCSDNIKQSIKHVYETLFKQEGFDIEHVIKELPLESDYFTCAIEDSVKEKMEKELGYNVERIGFLYGRYFKDKKELRIYDLVNAEELEKIIGKNILFMDENSCCITGIL